VKVEGLKAKAYQRTRMKPLYQISAALVAVFALTATGYASTVLVDDTWADGTRNNTSLPIESAWYAAGASTLTPAVGSMAGTVAAASSSTWWTYFTPAGSPASLAIGETLKVTLSFTPTGVVSSNANRGLRFGVFDYTGGTPRTTDGGSPSGVGVTGYMNSMNFGTTFSANPIQSMSRTNIPGANLLSASADFTSLGSGGAAAGSAGFTDGIKYTLEYSLTRNADSVDINTAFSAGAWSISYSVTDTNSTRSFNFDTFVFRPARADQSASTITFSEFKVEVLQVPEPSSFVLFGGFGLLAFFFLRRR
jgi:hypothetical protein